MRISLYSPFYECRKGKELSDWAIKANNKQFHNYYCLTPKGQITQPPKCIQAYIHYIAEDRNGFPKYEAIDIGLNMKRYIISRDEGLLIAIRDELRLPDRCYDFFTTKEDGDDNYYS